MLAGFLLIYPETDRFVCNRLEYGVSQKGIGLDGYADEPILSAIQIEGKSRKGIGEDGYMAVNYWLFMKQKPDMTWDRDSLMARVGGS